MKNEDSEVLKSRKCVVRFPVLVMVIGLVFLCTYLNLKKRRASHATTSPAQDGNTSTGLHPIPLPEDQAEEDRHYDRVPPRYSTVDHPPPYSLVRSHCHQITTFLTYRSMFDQSHRWYCESITNSSHHRDIRVQ